MKKQMAIIGGMLFVVAVVAVGAVHQGTGNLEDAVEVYEEERHDGERASRDNFQYFPQLRLGFLY